MRKLEIPVGLVRDRSLPAAVMGTYVVLAGLCKDGNRCTVKRRDLMKTLGVRSLTTVRSYLRKLQEHGWIEFEYVRTAGHTVVVLHDIDEERMIRHLELIRRRLERAEFKGEGIMKEWLDLLVDTDQHDDNARPGFLVNPLTGERLEFDRWYPCGVAFEFNGPQHYRPTEAYSDPEQLRRTRLRDAIKRGLGQELGIKVVIVRPEDLSYDGIRAKVEGLLPLRDIPLDDPRVQLLMRVSLNYLSKVKSES